MADERIVVTKERLDGRYRLSAYWLAKMTSELAFVLLSPVLTWIIPYFMSGLPLDVTVFLQTTCTVVLTGLIFQVTN